MALPTEEEERLAEVRDWACDIFAPRKRQKKYAGELIAGRAAWPTPDLPTAAIAAALDSGPCSRRSTQALRGQIRASLPWAAPASGQADIAARIANAAVLAHVPMSVIRDLSAVARRSPGLWASLQNGRLACGLAVRVPAETLEVYGRARAKSVGEEELQLWRSHCEGSEKGGKAAGGSAPLRPTGVVDEGGNVAGRGEEKKLEPSGNASLRPYQEAALHAVQQASPTNCCVVLPCGAGKTKLGSAIACDFLASHDDGCVLVLCMRREGARQWAQELRSCWRTNAVDASETSKPDDFRRSRLVLVTYARILSDYRRAAKAGNHSGGPIAERFTAMPAGLIIADECHMVPAPRIGALLQALQSSPQQRLVGLTGTLLREGGLPSCSSGSAAKESLDESGGPVQDDSHEAPWPILGQCVFKETFASLAPEYLAPVRCVEISVPVKGPWVDLFEKQHLAAVVCLSEGKWKALEHLLAKHADDSLLIMVERCDEARLIASTFGILPIDGSVSASQVSGYISRFRRGKIRCIVATHILDDSADFPELTVMIQVGGFFKSRRQEQQRLGRLLRWGPMKRQRWELNGERPTFYVLVHEGTVEAEMSRHRTSAVAGVEYERLALEDLMTSPGSPLGVGDLFFGVCETTDEVPPGLATYNTEAMEASRVLHERCFEMSSRLAASLPGGLINRESRLEEARRFLESVGLRRPEPEEISDDETDGETASANNKRLKAALADDGSQAERREQTVEKEGDVPLDSPSSSSSASDSSSSSCSSSSSPSSQGWTSAVQRRRAKARQELAAQKPKLRRCEQTSVGKGRGRGRGRGGRRGHQSQIAQSDGGQTTEAAELAAPAGAIAAAQKVSAVAASAGVAPIKAFAFSFRRPGDAPGSPVDLDVD